MKCLNGLATLFTYQRAGRRTNSLVKTFKLNSSGYGIFLKNFTAAATYIPNIIILDSNKFSFLRFTKLAPTRGYLFNTE